MNTFFWIHILIIEGLGGIPPGGPKPRLRLGPESELAHNLGEVSDCLEWSPILILAKLLDADCVTKTLRD